ncbi:DUF6357 family protein [Aeromicrobium alkaliterrae]|uniref:CchlT n=1 Tax=Aeromicrobium alkaliterrae TaxID=302168 RepID=A0ABN2JGI8_9ACTN
MSDIVLTRTGWIPRVVRDGDGLRLQLGAGANANHDPRTFSFPISKAHLDVLRDDLARHLLLWVAVLPLCSAAGTEGPLDEDAAVALLDPILLGSPAEVDAFLRDVPTELITLVRYGADIALMERGQLVESLHAATEEADIQRAQTYVANRQRAKRGVVLAPLDEAVLKYVGHYIHGSTRPGRNPDAVDPELLPEVLAVVATAEQAAEGLEIHRDPRRGKHATDKQDWKRMTTAVEEALGRDHGRLAADAVRSVAFLICSEAADRTKNSPEPDRVVGPGAKTALTFTDEDGGDEQEWRANDSTQGAAAAFWAFVTEHSGNDVFTVEDKNLGEGVQVHFYADTAARVTTAVPGRNGAEPQYRVEYALVDGMSGYRALLDTFVGGGCAALDPHGPWMLDPEELERARKGRDLGKSRP